MMLKDAKINANGKTGTNILVHGLGRLGRSVCAAVADGGAQRGLSVVAAIKNTPLASNEVAKFDFPVYTNVADCSCNADVIVDCSVASATGGIVAHALQTRTPLVICTTGHSDEVDSAIKAAAELIPVFVSANMSLGVNIAVKLAAIAAKALNNYDFDIEILERHHNQKLDAPSGTARWLADSIFDAIGEKQVVYDRSETLAKRGKEQVGIHSIRGGTIVGDHTVIFAGPDETIEIKHSALSRDAFARGVLAAAVFTARQAPGLYVMDDLINL